MKRPENRNETARIPLFYCERYQQHENVLKKTILLLDIEGDMLEKTPIPFLFRRFPPLIISFLLYFTLFLISLVSLVGLVINAASQINTGASEDFPLKNAF